MQSMQSEMDFTIIRPGGLKQEPATGTGVLSEDINVCGAIHREDVAELAVRALFSPRAANKVTSSCFIAVACCCGSLLSLAAVALRCAAGFNTIMAAGSGSCRQEPAHGADKCAAI